MSKPSTPLPADHAFVLQLQASKGHPEICHTGRIEHLSTGEAKRFTTTEELWDFIDSVLMPLTDLRDRPEREGDLT